MSTAGFVSLSLLFSTKTPHPFGLGVGGSVQMALADRDGCCEGPRIIGVAGLDLRAELRSMRSPWLSIAPSIGAAIPDLADSGWHPYAMVRAEAGAALSSAGIAPLVGALLTKDLSPCFTSSCSFMAPALVDIGASTTLNTDGDRTLPSQPHLWLSGVAQVTPMVTYH